MKVLLFIWGMTSFIILISECNDLITFTFIKVLALFSLALCALIAKRVIVIREEDNQA